LQPLYLPFELPLTKKTTFWTCRVEEIKYLCKQFLQLNYYFKQCKESTILIK
jgi:hypothetical protein